jgi:hypothetical protein
MSAHRIFLLSPAQCGGKRAGLIFNDAARFALAQRLRQPQGVPIGEVFSFLSGLYFRGKLAYSQAFATPPPGLAGVYAITSNRGLLPIDTPVTLADLAAFGAVDIQLEDDRYATPLRREAQRLLGQMHPTCEVVLLGSVASGKYVDLLLEIFGDRLHFPEEFIGRGDMSRGGLMLRCAQGSRQLSYIPVAGAVRRGKRPPKLKPL